MSRNSNTMNMQFENHTLQRYSEVDLFSTDGRIGSKRYFLYSVLLPFIIFWSLASIAGVLTYMGSAATLASYAILGVAIIAMLFILVRLTIQRCHDFNKSGWLAILAVVPFSNIIFALIPGTNGLNQYGEVPEPANKLTNILFYLLIAALTAMTAFLLYQLFNGDIINSAMQRWFTF
ncbi:uncharacterized membrane protein YhaH (DUF805 family) [Cocleimonas flava]|uniref:Uncharacterized membrane protein YhaH (DUF805 family) n=2 Tax=Thiotrichaceae TaxID=135617 RepID=A0A4R1F545_9GAMM|nr:uncharacterized membrane protein YhaH (DUF805 family) [Cocleimonas flava]